MSFSYISPYLSSITCGCVQNTAADAACVSVCLQVTQELVVRASQYNINKITRYYIEIPIERYYLENFSILTKMSKNFVKFVFNFIILFHFPIFIFAEIY